MRIKLIPLILFQCFIFQIIVSIYEDQIGKFDWHKQYIGRVDDVINDDSGDSIFVTNYENAVVSRVDSKTSVILWRQSLREGSNDFHTKIENMWTDLIYRKTENNVKEEQSTTLFVLTSSSVSSLNMNENRDRLLNYIPENNRISSKLRAFNTKDNSLTYEINLPNVENTFPSISSTIDELILLRYERGECGYKMKKNAKKFITYLLTDNQICSINTLDGRVVWCTNFWKELMKSVNFVCPIEVMQFNFDIYLIFSSYGDSSNIHVMKLNEINGVIKSIGTINSQNLLTSKQLSTILLNDEQLVLVYLDENNGTHLNLKLTLIENDDINKKLLSSYTIVHDQYNERIDNHFQSIKYQLTLQQFNREKKFGKKKLLFISNERTGQLLFASFTFNRLIRQETLLSTNDFDEDNEDVRKYETIFEDSMKLISFTSIDTEIESFDLYYSGREDIYLFLYRMEEIRHHESYHSDKFSVQIKQAKLLENDVNWEEVKLLSSSFDISSSCSHINRLVLSSCRRRLLTSKVYAPNVHNVGFHRPLYHLYLQFSDLLWLSFVNGNNITWQREEAPANIIATKLLDLPLSRQQDTTIDDNENDIHSDNEENRNESTDGQETDEHKYDYHHYKHSMNPIIILKQYVRRLKLESSLLKTNSIYYIRKLMKIIAKYSDYFRRSTDLAVTGRKSKFEQQMMNDVNQYFDWKNDEHLLVRDALNMNKVIIIITSIGKVFAMHSVNGRIIWSNNVRSSILPFLKNEQDAISMNTKNIRRIYQFLLNHQKNHQEEIDYIWDDLLSHIDSRVFHYSLNHLRTDTHLPHVAQIGVTGYNNNISCVSTIILDPYNGSLYNRYDTKDEGKNFRFVSSFLSTDIVPPTQHIDNSLPPLNIHPLIVLTMDDEDDLKINQIPQTKDDYLHPKLFSLLANQEKGILEGYCIQNYSPQLTWRFVLPKNEILYKIFRRPEHDPIHAYGVVLGDRSLLYKYRHPHMIIVATLTYDSIMKIQSVSIYAICSVTGKHLWNAKHRQATLPILGDIAENWFVYSVYDMKQWRNELSVVEFFDGFQQNNGSHFSAFKTKRPISIWKLNEELMKAHKKEKNDSENPNDVVKVVRPKLIFDKLLNYFAFHTKEKKENEKLYSIPFYINRTYTFPFFFHDFRITTTKRGISSRNLIISTTNGIIYDIPWKLIDPRQPDYPNLEHREEGILPYNPELIFPFDRTLNYYRRVLPIRRIVTTCAEIESASLIFVYGSNDLFYTRVFPSMMFDLLSEDFDYSLISLVVISLLALTLISRRLAINSQLETAWK